MTLRLAFAGTALAALLAAAAPGAASAAPAVGAGLGGPGFTGPGIVNVRGGFGRRFDRQRFGRRSFGHGFGQGVFGQGFGAYGLVAPDGSDEAAVPQPGVPAATRQTVNMRVHPTYSELPVYARTSAPSLQRITRTRHGVHVSTVVFSQPATRDVDLTPGF